MAVLPKLTMNESLENYNDHTQPHRGTTVPQLTLFIVWAAAIVLWVMGRASKANLVPKLWPVPPGPSAGDDGGSMRPLTDRVVAVAVNGRTAAVDPQMDGEAGGGQVALPDATEGSTDQRRTTTNWTNNSGGGTTTTVVATATTKQNFSATIPPPSLQQLLRQIALLGIIMIYFYMCEYRKVSCS